jgi:hypothetical protein
MEKWFVNLDTIDITITHPDIRIIFNPNYADLRREIMEFNHEIKWDDMWTFYDAEKRLSERWLFVGFFVDHQIKGWVWFNPKDNFLYNLYINKKYRNFYNAKNLVLYLMMKCKEMGVKTMYTKTDSWNKNSRLIALKTGWNLINE